MDVSRPTGHVSSESITDREIDMDDEEFDRRVASSAPSVAHRTPAVRAAIEGVVAESRPPRRRRTRMLIAGATLSVVLLGGTTTAFASQYLLDWLGFTPDHTIQHRNADGDYCAAGMIVRPEGVEMDDPSFLAAQQIFRAIDFETLKIPAHIRDDDRYSDARRAEKIKYFDEYNAAHPEAPMAPPMWDPETEMLSATAYEVVVAGVKERGLDDSRFSIEGGAQCDRVGE